MSWAPLLKGEIWMFNLENKIALVTGSARGIGKEIAAFLAAQGTKVVINDINETLLQETAKEIGASRAIRADVTNQDEVNAMVDTIINEFNRIDLLVNNAGIIGLNKFENITLNEWNTMLNVHLNGTFLCSQAVIGPMKTQQSGKIINISSNWGQRGASEAVHYSAVKAGIIGFTKALAREVAEDGILVNSVAPGPIETEMIAEEAKLLGVTEENVRSNLIETIPTGRLGQTIEIAGAVAYLASDLGNFYCGQVIAPNGGEVI
jgi:3-oxoacyl-[acyl-carrier protein] reductase